MTFINRIAPMHHGALLLVLLVLAAFSPPHAYSQTRQARQDGKETKLDELTVTATRTPRTLQETPAAVELITREDLENERGWNLGETLESVPGLLSESKNGGYDTHVIIRGAGAKALYGVREIMIMVDGIPITDPDSLTRLDMVDPSIIEKIEVVKGPNSTMYGANASGGVINIITKSPMETGGLSLRTALGSYNSKEAHLQYGGMLGDVYYMLSGTHRSTDSWRKHNEFDTNQFNARMQYSPEESTEYDVSLSHSVAHMQLPGSLNEADFKADPTQQAPDWMHMGRDSVSSRVALGYRRGTPGGNELIAQTYAQKWSHYHPVGTGINDGGANVYGLELQGNIAHSLIGAQGVLSLGLSAQLDDRDSFKYTYRDMNTAVINGKVVAVTPYTNSDKKGDVMEHTLNNVAKYGVFVQESLRFESNTILDLGLRLDRVHFDLDNDLQWQWTYRTTSAGVAYFNYMLTPERIKVERDFNAVSPRIGVTHPLNDQVNVYGSVSTGFQTPAQSELETNLALDPQRTINYETGLRAHTDAGHTVDAAVFYTTIKDEMIQLLDSAGTSYYDNAGSTVHKGLELSSALAVTERLTFGLNYAYSDFTFTEYREMEKQGFPVTIVTHVRDGNQIPLVPKHKYTLSLDYRRPEGISAHLSAVTWGKYYIDTANTETYSGFTVLNTKLAFDRDALGLFIQVSNLLDEKYAAEVSKSYGTTKYAPGAPRTITVGATYKF